MNRDDWLVVVGVRITVELCCIVGGVGVAGLLWAFGQDRKAVLVFIVCGLISWAVRPSPESVATFTEFQKHRRQFPQR